VPFDAGRVGPVRALNLACARARAPLLARLDADDVCLPARLERQRAFLESNPAVAVVGGAIGLIDASGRRFGTARFPERPAAIARQLRVRNCLAHPAVLMRRAVFEAVGGFREAFDLAEDYDLWLRVSERWQLANLRDEVLLYRVHRDQASLGECERQALRALAARLCARIRRRGGAEPALDGEMSHAMLEALGASRTEIAEAVVEQYLAWAGILANALPLGAPEVERLLASAGTAGADVGVRRPVESARQWTRAKQLARDQPARAVWPVLVSVATDPRVPLRRLLRWGRDQLRRRAAPNPPSGFPRG